MLLINSLVLASLCSVLTLTLAMAATPPQPPEVRILDGTLYFINTSTNWVELADGMEVIEVLPEGVVSQIVRYRPIYRRNPQTAPGTSNAQGRLLRTEKLLVGKCIIRNHPQHGTLTSGASVYNRFRVFPRGVFKYGAETIAAYDCGLPNTTENRKTLKKPK